MSTTFYVIMQKRRDGMVYADLHKTDHRFYLTPEDAQWALEKDTPNPEYFHVVELVAMTVGDWNELMKREAFKDGVKHAQGFMAMPNAK